MPFSEGEQVGPYRIIKQIGQGGMATVYKAYHDNLARHVAIKVLHPAFMEDDNFFERFKREARIVASLEHPNIIPIYDFAEYQPEESSNREPYIVMKLVEGDTLKHRKKRQSLTLQETLKIMTAVAGGLDYAHRRNILHRDIKPSNVMLDEDDVPYLADFGLARIASSGESTMSQDVLIGTPHYISPEQARGDKDLGPATDIYSMGVMLYEIVVGRVPFSSDMPYSIIHDHIYKPVPLPTKFNPAVPESVAQVLLKALAKTPEDRYETTIDMINAFRQAVEESDMKELSITGVRVGRLSSPSESPPPKQPASSAQVVQEKAPPPAVIPSAESAESEVVSGTLMPEQQKPATGTPPPSASAIPYPGYQEYKKYSSSVARRRRQARYQFWILLGIAGLVFTCIASLAVAINAASKPGLLANPTAEVEENTTTEETVDKRFFDANLTIEEAEELVVEYPDEPAAHLTLGLIYYDAGQVEKGLESIFYAITTLQAPAEDIAAVANLTASAGRDLEALQLWFTALQVEPDNPDIRESAGRYIYTQFSTATPDELREIEGLLEADSDTPLGKILIAHALISLAERDLTSGSSVLNQANTLLDEAFEQNNGLAEGFLVRGNYYAARGDYETARQDWRRAGSFADAPDWVNREVTIQIQNIPASAEAEEFKSQE